MAQEWQYYLLLTAVLLLPLLLAKLRPPRQHGKNLPPGPWRLPVIGSMHHLAGKLPHRAMRDLARRHGPLMLLRVGELDVVVASSADAAREIMKTHDLTFATRPRTATARAFTRDGLGIGLAPHGEHWRQMRKLCATELLSARRVRSLRGPRETEASSLVASVAAAVSAAPSRPVNVSSLIATHTLDSVVRAVVGERIRDRDAFLASLDDGFKLGAAGFSLADLFPSSRLALALSGTVRRAEAVARELSRLMDGVVEDHRTRRLAGASAGDEEEDLLDVLLRIQSDGGNAVPLDTGAIRSVIRDLCGAGTETSASTLQWAMAELMRNPEALHRAQAEVRGALAGQSLVTEDALPGLRYMQLVIKETLRLHAAIPLPRECREPCRVLGYDVPQGAMVLVNVWAICQDTATWSADAEEFRPERFDEVVGGGAMVDFRGTDFEFVPFGAGRRICPGIAFALATMELALANLLFHFDWELPGGTAPGDLDMAESYGVALSRKSDLWLHATVRVPPATT